MVNPKKIAKEYFEAIPKGDFEKARKLFHPKYTYTGGDGQRYEGADAGIAVAEMYTKAFPDLRIEIKHIYVDGNTVIVEFTGNGTHKGELMGIAPKGKKISVNVCNILEIRDDKIYAEREYFDSGHLLKQLDAEESKKHAMA